MEVPKPCIYRVPSRIRDAKPKAYTPRMVLIGPLHRSLKAVDAKDGAASSDPWDLKKIYHKMEVLKKTYFESYTKRVGEDTIEEMRKTIQVEEKNIRASYEDSTEWIQSEDFVDLILYDSVFIMELITCIHHQKPEEQLSESSMVTITNDLFLLENQLPYFIFRTLFSSSMKKIDKTVTLDRLIRSFFSKRIKEKTDFKHFTDMLRCVYEESLGNIPMPTKKSRLRWTYDHGRWPAIIELKNADKLSQAGVKFKVHGDRRNEERPLINNLSLHVEFKKGVLTMPSFHANEASDMFLRNVIAFEHCHVAGVTPFTSNYMSFLNFLITSDKDVELLSEAGVVTNSMGSPSYVVDMVRKLQVDENVGTSSQYHKVATKLTDHYNSRRKKSWATLKRVYFSDMWTGTATAAAVVLVILTLIGTVASVIQAYKSF